MTYTLDEVNQMDHETFVQVFGSVFEHTPQIAYQAWQLRPFGDEANLHQVMVKIVEERSYEQQLALIRAHPDLGSKVQMASASLQEQASIGLDQLSLEEYERFQQLSQTYTSKFGFPFIIAVRNHTKDSILAAFEQRLNHSLADEHRQALREIYAITFFRVSELVTVTR